MMVTTTLTAMTTIMTEAMIKVAMKGTPASSPDDGWRPVKGSSVGVVHMPTDLQDDKQHEDETDKQQ